jgi:hypothetical protein
VEVGQLLIELVPGLGELVEAHHALGVGGVVAWCWLRVGGAVLTVYFGTPNMFITLWF